MTSQTGSSLIETTIAIGILLVVLTGLLSMAAIATTLTENHGHLAARTTEYAQDKMEQLLVLAFGDSTSNTALFPATHTGGTGLGVGGSSDPASPAAGYVDWLDSDGNLLISSGTAAPAGWFYKRVWAISSPSANLKEISVTTIVKASIGNTLIPQSTVTALKAYPF